MARFKACLDADAFDELMRRYTSPALAVANGIMDHAGDGHAAEDAVQEAFLRVIRSRKKFRTSRPFSSWFYTILRNVCTDMIRRRLHHKKCRTNYVMNQQAFGSTCISYTSSPWKDIDASDILAGLSKDDRMVLTLRIVHEMPFVDVAAAMGISTEAAKKRAQRALRRLRKSGRMRRLYKDSTGEEEEISGDISKKIVPPRTV